MIKIKKIFFNTIKLIATIVVIFLIVLFFYAAFFYKADNVEKKSQVNEAPENEKTLEPAAEEPVAEEPVSEEPKIEKKVTLPKIEVIEDGIFVVIGDKAVTKSDIVNEIKIILILNNMSYSSDLRQELQDIAVKSTVKRVIKEIEVSKHDYLEFSKNDMKNELIRLANKINMDVETLKNICISNGLDFKIIENQVKTELLWNSLIFNQYANRITINVEEIDEQLKQNQDKKEFKEYLISEIVIKSVEKDKIESKIEEVKNKIDNEGFETVAMSLSISQTAVKGGDMGWVNESEISKKFRTKISNTPIGSISEPILLKEGILFFKVRDKRKIKKEANMEELKNRLVNAEKTKILQMYSVSHYDKLRRTISINFFND